MPTEKSSRFLELLKFSEPQKIERELKTIDELQHKNVVTFLVNTIYGPDDLETSKNAIEVLRHIRKELVMKELVDVVNSDMHPELRMAAIRVLGGFKDETAIPILEKVVNRSDNQELIQSASVAIQVIQGVTGDTSQDH